MRRTLLRCLIGTRVLKKIDPWTVVRKTSSCARSCSIEANLFVGCVGDTGVRTSVASWRMRRCAKCA